MIKAILFVTSTLFVSIGMAGELPQCDATNKSQVSYEDPTVKVTFVTGDQAKQIYQGLETEEVAPKAGTFEPDYLQKAVVKAKYTDEMVCWKMQPPQYTNGQYTGVSTCEGYSCNVIERTINRSK